MTTLPEDPPRWLIAYLVVLFVVIALIIAGSLVL